MAYDKLGEDAVSKLLENRIDQSESQQWAGKVQTDASETRFLLLTDCCLYVFTSPGGNKFDKEKTKSIFDLVSCTAEGNNLTVTFSNETLKFVTPDAEHLKTNLFRQYRYLTWDLNVRAFSGLAMIVQAQAGVPMNRPPQRPEHILLHRYIAASVSKGKPIEQEAASVARSFDQRPGNMLELKGFEMADVSAFFYALSMEPHLRTVVLDNFGGGKFGEILNSMLVGPNQLNHLVLKNYHAFDNYQESFAGLKFRRSSYNSVTRITFESCKSLFVQQFLQVMKPASYAVSCVVFQKMKFSDTLSQVFLTAIENYTFTGEIESLVFADFECELPLFEFLKRVVDVSESLKQLVVKNCGIDICPFIAALSKVQCGLQSLSMRRNYGHSSMTSDDVVPESIMYLDVGDCDWTAQAMSSFFAALLRWTRKLPMILRIDQSRLDTSWSDVLSNIRVDRCKPVLTELDIGDNEMDAKAFSQFVHILGSQSPPLTQSPLKLMHLNVSRCIKSDVEECVKLLGNFSSIRQLWGLELADTVDEAHADVLELLIEKLREVQGLTCLDISGNYFQQESAKALIDFVRDSPSIAEIGLDRVGGDASSMLDLYKGIVMSSHILAMKTPIEDLESLDNDAETSRIYKRLFMKRQFSTPYCRLMLYLYLCNEHSIRVIKPYSEVDDVWEEEPLSESNFRNPIPAMSKLESMSDNAMDPLASMVIECISTSGQYGIIPPTVPPTYAPSGQMSLPAIFGTMEAPAEDFTLVDETADELLSLSADIAELVTKSNPPLFDPQHDCDPKRVMCVPVVDFPK